MIGAGGIYLLRQPEIEMGRSSVAELGDGPLLSATRSRPESAGGRSPWRCRGGDQQKRSSKQR